MGRFAPNRKIKTICERTRNGITPSNDRINIGLRAEQIEYFTGDSMFDDDRDLAKYAKWFEEGSEAQLHLELGNWRHRTDLLQVDDRGGIHTTTVTSGCDYLGISMEKVGEEIFGTKPKY